MKGWLRVSFRSALLAIIGYVSGVVSIIFLQLDFEFWIYFFLIHIVLLSIVIVQLKKQKK